MTPVMSGNGTLDVSIGGRARIDCPRQNVAVQMVGGSSSIGESMFVFSPNNPRLYFVNAAGQAIDPATLSAVNVSFQVASNNVAVFRDFTLRGENFLGDVPVTVVAAPDYGAFVITNLVMHFPTNTFTTVTATVTLNMGINQNTHVNAYARYVLPQ